MEWNGMKLIYSFYYELTYRVSLIIMRLNKLIRHVTQRGECFGNTL